MHSANRDRFREPKNESLVVEQPSSWRARARQKLGPQWRVGLIFVSPFIVVFGVFNLWPNINSLILSFQKYQGFGEARWVGFDNYAALLQYPVFWQELGNTIVYWVVHAIVLIPLAFVLAVLVNSKWLRGRKTWQAIIFLPQVISIVAVTLVFKILFSTQNGVVNEIFGTNIPWITDFALARWVVVLMLIWQGLGFWFIVFLAGISSIDPEIDEAASIDGASAWRRLISITFPLMRHMLLFAVVIDAIGSMALYTQPNVLFGASAAGAPPEVAPLSNLVVANLLSGTFGQSAAAGWMLFFLTLVVSALIFGLNRVIKGGSDE